MSENISNLYSKIDFLVNGGALKSLTDYLTEKNIKALVVEPEDSGKLNVMDAAGVIPQSLTLEDNITKLFTSGVAKENYELDYSDGIKDWPGVVRVRGGQWKIYILLQNKPAKPDALIEELKPYAGLIGLWQTYKKISDTEKKLSRLSYMILATKSTLASIFEPMPLQYFASFLTDVLRESLFPKSVAILKDEGNYLSVFNGKAENIPERKGIYASQILPPAPVVVKNNEEIAEVVLPVAEGDCRLFCLIQWDELPDDQTMNFLELLGNLAVRAIAINNLRIQSQQAQANISTGEFTVLSLSNVLKILRGAEDKSRFLSLLVDIFMEQCRMQNCLLATWNKARKGYAITEYRTGSIKADMDPTLLPSSSPASVANINNSYYDLTEKSPDAIFKSWGLAGCPWKDALKSSDAKYIFPVCDDNSLVGILALGAGQKGTNALDRSQLASLQLIAQFAAYEFRRFE
ncbi:MAG: hypothetical protein IJU48_10545 [Synergistaceae bacterium]|nr:hypothetical protein [Synergistaceae bacterium]